VLWQLFRNGRDRMADRVVRCSSCGKQNRLPSLQEGKRAVCGSCKAPLPARGVPLVLTDSTFHEGVRKGRMVVDFWAAWCGPCRMIAPIIEEMAAERADVTFAKLNVDENPRTAAEYNVQGIPLLVLLRDGAEVGRVTGAVPRGQIDAAIERYLG
jgi:thioredoxin 2